MTGESGAIGQLTAWRGRQEWPGQRYPVSPTTLPDPQERPEITRAPATAFVIGLVAGALSALLGIGGGLIMVPAMVAMLRLRQHRAVGTSLAVILPTAAVAALQYNFAFEKSGAEGLQLAVIAWLSAGGVVGALIGAVVANAIGAKSLRRIFGIFVILSGVVMIAKASGFWPGGGSGQPAALGVTQGFQMLLVGALVGVIAALLGVGGGLVMVPALALLLGYDQHLAQGTSLAVIIPVSISGAYAHTRRGNVVWPLVGPMGLGAVLGAAVVANTVFHIRAPSLQTMFGLFMLAVGIGMARNRTTPRRSGDTGTQGERSG
jgi:uncharacterized membrane protein YfcA